MKRAIVAIVALVALAAAAAAGDVFVPNNTLPSSTGCNNYPFNPSYGEWRYQLIVPPTLLGGVPIEITDVSFAPCQTVTFSATTFEMTMSHTTLPTPSSTYALNLPSPVVVIPAGPLTWQRTAHTWSTLRLATPFQYNGMDSLTIEVRYQGGSITGATSSTDNQTSSSSLNYYRVYRSGTGAYLATTASSVTLTGALMVRLTYSDIQIYGSGQPSIGKVITLVLRSPTEGGLPYQAGTSLGTGPIVIGQRRLGLSLDDLLVVTVEGRLPAVFQQYAGLLDAAGLAQAKIAIPNSPALVGVRLHSAFLTLGAGSPFGIKSISNTFSFTVMR
ncbi:MAG: hypothetical protein JXQ29_09505 [Planctomycetes bacterium]|nr:hypothetical protein [Planctomycetota bacterium]